MPKTFSILFVAMFALLFAGAAMAAPADQTATVQAMEVEPPLCEISVQAPPSETPPDETPPVDIEECGDIFCPPNFFCCDPLDNLCLPEGEACIL